MPMPPVPVAPNLPPASAPAGGSAKSGPAEAAQPQGGDAGAAPPPASFHATLAEQVRKLGGAKKGGKNHEAASAAGTAPGGGAAAQAVLAAAQGVPLAAAQAPAGGAKAAAPGPQDLAARYALRTAHDVGAQAKVAAPGKDALPPQAAPTSTDASTAAPPSQVLAAAPSTGARLAARTFGAGEQTQPAASGARASIASRADAPTHADLQALQGDPSGAAAPGASANAAAGVSGAPPQQVLAGASKGGDGHGASAPAPLTIDQPVSSPAWGNALGERVVWMAGQSQQSAALHLNPPHLGPIEVQLTLSNDQANAVFVADHPAVREAIQSALPQLRESLAQSGIALGNVSVGSQSSSQQSFGHGGRGTHAGHSAEPQLAGLAAKAAGVKGYGGTGMVDLFA